MLVMLPILPVYTFFRHISAERFFQSIASGALDARAYRGGLLTALLGAGFHLAFSILAAAAFLIIARLWRRLRRHTVSRRLAFGAGTAGTMASSLLIHMIGFGLPVALVGFWLHPDRPGGYAIPFVASAVSAL
jgi:hypothetical protein